QREVEVFASVRSRDLSPEPRLALGHDGVPQSFYVYAFLEQELAHVLRDGRLAEHHRHDRMTALDDPEPELDDSSSKVGGVVVKLIDYRSVFLNDPDRLDRCGNNRGRHRV